MKTSSVICYLFLSISVCFAGPIEQYQREDRNDDPAHWPSRGTPSLEPLDGATKPTIVRDPKGKNIIPAGKIYPENLENPYTKNSNATPQLNPFSPSYKPIFYTRAAQGKKSSGWKKYPVK